MPEPHSFTNPQVVLAPIAVGELIDKITILRLKQARLKSPEALENVRKELGALDHTLKQLQASDLFGALSEPEMGHLTEELQAINTRLWDVEDALRCHEAEQRFDRDFIELARSVYQLNDQRAAIKRAINRCCGSPLIEEKSYGEVS